MKIIFKGLFCFLSQTILILHIVIYIYIYMCVCVCVHDNSICYNSFMQIVF